jgi:hypothetical protein
MIKRVINEFMWGYQQHFRVAVQRNAEKVFRIIGLEVVPEVFLVGVLASEAGPNHPVCVDPEDGPWRSSLFPGLPEEVAAEIPKHRLQNMFFGHQRTMEQLPEKIRRSVVTETVHRRVAPLDAADDQESFCSYAYRIADYYVVVVLRMPGWVFREFQPLPDEEIDNDPYPLSFIHACIGDILEAATLALAMPDPGENVADDLRSAEDIVRRAGSRFMHAPGVMLRDRACWADLFATLNQISSLRYEGEGGVGSLLLIDPDSEHIEYVLRLKRPVRLNEPRWARKLLQMASGDASLIATYQDIHGVGRLSSEAPADCAFAVDFFEHFQWQLRRNRQVLLQARYGEPRLPRAEVHRSRFRDNVERLFAGADVHPDLLWDIAEIMAAQPHGNTVVVAADAAAEAARLAAQGTPIV